MKVDKLKEFSKKIEGKLLFNYSLKKTNWFNIGGITKAYFKPDSLKDLLIFLKEFGNKEKIFLLGAGSNVLINDEIFDGIIIKLGKNFSNISLLSQDTVIAGSSTTDKRLSEFASENNIGGLEFLSCIPGTVGGGLRMNSGCFGREFKDILISVQAVDKIGKVITIPASQINFGYRNNDLDRNLIFLSASFRGTYRERKKIESDIDLNDRSIPFNLVDEKSYNLFLNQESQIGELVKKDLRLDNFGLFSRLREGKDNF